MANTVVNRSVNIFIESGQAQKALDALIKKENALKDALLKATDPRQVASLTDQLNKLSEPLSRASKKVSGELTPSFKDLQATANALGNRLRKMSQEDADYTPVLKQYHEATKALEVQKGMVTSLGTAMRSFASEAKAVAVGMLVGNSIQGAMQTVAGYVSSIVTGSAKISDELADIQRVTGLTKDDVRILNDELAKIDTRTSVTSLREIAVVAGKLGVAKEDILGFVEATDKLNVALGGELGDVNAITTELGKILTVFDGKITGDNITKLGNAIVDLANKGVASGPFIVDFTQRMSGIAKTANLSLSAVIGFAAGMEETGQKVESSSTAMQKLLTTIAQDLPKAARIAGATGQQQINQFIETFATKPEEAILQFAQGLQKNKQSFAEIASSFKDAGEDGARVISTLATLGTKADFFRTKIKDASAATQEATQINKSFALQNTTLGAQLDKVKKSIDSIFQSQTFRDAAQKMINAVVGFMNVLKALPQFVRENETAVKLLVLGLVFLNAQYLLSAYNIAKDTAAKVINAVVTKATAIWQNVAAAATTVYSAVVLVLTGRITAATAATVIWRTAIAAGLGPFGIFLTIIGAIVIGISEWYKSTKSLTAAQQVQAELSKKIADATQEELASINVLVRTATNLNLSYDQRKRALNELIAKSPEYLNGLTLENISTKKGTDLLGEYINKLKEAAKAKAINQLATDKELEKIKLETEKSGLNTAKNPNDLSIDAETKRSKNVTRSREIDQQIKGIDNELNILYSKMGTQAPPVIPPASGAKSKETIKEVGESINSLKAKLKELQDKRDATPDEQARASFNKQIKETEDRIALMEGNVAKLGKAENKAANDTKELADELKRLATSLLPEGSLTQQFDKQLKELDDKYDKLKTKAHGNVKLLQEIDRLYILERNGLYADQAGKFKETIDKESEQLRKVAAERATNLALLMPLTAKVGESAVKLSATIGRDRMAKAELDAITSSGKDKLNAELRLLREQHLQELNQKELTENEKLLLEEKYRQKRKELELQFYVDLAKQVLEFAGQIVNIFNVIGEARTNKENAELERDKAINDKKKKNLEDRLKKGLISQKQYDSEVQRIDKEQEKREKETRLKQFKRDQRAQIVQALMNGAQAVVSVLAARPGSLDVISLGLFRAINIGLSVAATAAQVAKIASQKPPQYAHGGRLYGPSHAAGGVQLFGKGGRHFGEAEGGEAIINKKSMSDTRRYAVSGTPSQIASAINSLYGVHWQPGAVIRPAWSTAKQQPINFSGINNSINQVRRFYATGGVIDNKPKAAAGEAQAAQDNSTALLQVMQQMIETNSQLNAQLAAGIQAYVSLSDINNQQQRLNAIRNDATMKA
jgi:TP901 family phage tail tape measure protein